MQNPRDVWFSDDLTGVGACPIGQEIRDVCAACEIGAAAGQGHTLFKRQAQAGDMVARVPVGVVFRAAPPGAGRGQPRGLHRQEGCC